MKKQLISGFALMAIGCNSGTDPAQQGTDQTVLDSTVAAQFSLDARSFCELVDLSTVVGHYEIERIVSEVGPNLRGHSREEPYITVTLRGESFLGETSPIKLKMQGGVWPDGSVNDTTLALKAGESVIAFLWTEWGDGSYQPHPDAVLHQRADGTFGSEYLMERESLTADDLKQRVRDARAGNCVDVRPNVELDDSARTVQEEPEHPVQMQSPDAGM